MRYRPYIHPRFGECASRSPRSMPLRFNPLAAYNGRVGQGIIHTEAKRREMAELQREFQEWHDDQMVQQGGKRVPGGGWILPAS